MSGEHSLALLCAVLEVSRSGFYAWRQRQQQPCARVRVNQALLGQIRETFVAMVDSVCDEAKRIEAGGGHHRRKN